DSVILAGSSRLMSEQGIETGDQSLAGETAVHVALDGRYAGSIILSDKLKNDSKITVQTLRTLGVRRIIMLTGDSRASARQVSQTLGLDEVYSQLLPEDKVTILERLTAESEHRGKVVFVGDGINDSPVLARADVGVAMGALGSDAAIEAADVVLMSDEPFQLVTALRVAKKTRSVLWQNIALALGVKGVVLILGVGGLAALWAAVFADVGVALLAVSNALRVVHGAINR
ncbi:MAG: HAD-IC family P-type ATPase, partial [Spirochaetota bacterium]